MNSRARTHTQTDLNNLRLHSTQLLFGFEQVNLSNWKYIYPVLVMELGITASTLAKGV